MKPVLIDTISTDSTTEHTVKEWDRDFTGWKISKPLFDYNFITRLIHAYYVLTGKAVAIRFFDDFNADEKAAYIKADLKKNAYIRINKQRTAEKEDVIPIPDEKNNEFVSDTELEIKKYVDKGVLREKIFVTKEPSICKWSHTKQKVADESNDGFDLISQKDGNFKMSFDNVVTVSLQPHKRLDVKKINKSNGIIITKYAGVFYRFGYVPRKP